VQCPRRQDVRGTAALPVKRSLYDVYDVDGTMLPAKTSKTPEESTASLDLGLRLLASPTSDYDAIGELIR
jgi:hypothetical protein